MRRRSFLATPLISQLAATQSPAAAPEQAIYAYGDGIPHSPDDYAKLLSRLVGDKKVEADSFSLGGMVEKLESQMAALLGKETAVWLPTGTLANHLAVRTLAGPKRRVIVQAESHLYNDCGDCCQTLSGLHLVPLGRGSATFTLEEVEKAASDASLGRVVTPIGAMQIESPVRRRSGEGFDFNEMKKIAAWARQREIGLHLDGARIFIESAYTQRPLKEYAALFDTVYVSLYKYFNAGSGAILAGPKALLANLFHTRRMFGGGLQQVWPFATIALHYLDGFEQRYRSAVECGEKVIRVLASDGNFEVQRIANGTNTFRMRPTSVNPPVYQLRLDTAGIRARTPEASWFNIQVNETWGRIPADEIVSRFRTALG
jgi:threonine aldolase